MVHWHPPSSTHAEVQVQPLHCVPLKNVSQVEWQLVLSHGGVGKVVLPKHVPSANTNNTIKKIKPHIVIILVDQL
jgi:hypothetical protein